MVNGLYLNSVIMRFIQITDIHYHFDIYYANFLMISYLV